jgi:hypothetical protein
MTKTQEIKKALQEEFPKGSWSVRKTRCNGWVGQVIEATYLTGELTETEEKTAFWVGKEHETHGYQIEIYPRDILTA